MSEPARVCECCPRMGGRPYRPAPAAYLWTCKLSGNEVLLCVTCCAYWRRNAAEDADLEPSRIHSLT